MRHSRSFTISRFFNLRISATALSKAAETLAAAAATASRVSSDTTLRSPRFRAIQSSIFVFLMRILSLQEYNPVLVSFFIAVALTARQDKVSKIASPAVLLGNQVITMPLAQHSIKRSSAICAARFKVFPHKLPPSPRRIRIDDTA
jgi:hypothetical protein